MPGFVATTIGMDDTNKFYDMVAKKSPLAQRNINRKLAERHKKLAKKNIHIGGSGETAKKITIRTGQNFADVIAGAPWSLYVEEGTAPHFIPYYPRTVNWAIGHGISFAMMNKAISTKGTRGQHFMSKAYNQVVRESRKIIDTEWKKLFSSKMGDF